MSHAPANPPRARTEVLADGSTVITIAGDWSAQVATPEITFKGDRIRLTAAELGGFDSSLPAWIHRHFRHVRQLDLSALPRRLRALVELTETSTSSEVDAQTPGLLEQFGDWGLASSSSWARAFEHIGETASACGRPWRRSSPSSRDTRPCSASPPPRSA